MSCSLDASQDRWPRGVYPAEAEAATVMLLGPWGRSIRHQFLVPIQPFANRGRRPVANGIVPKQLTWPIAHCRRSLGE